MAFLTPDTDQIKHQIRGILDSYSHDWDVLAELGQNSIDAICRKGPTRGHINITVDSPNKTIEFSDNGSGIDPNQLQRLLRPFATDKRGMENQIGQKGVGLTFVLFSSAVFEVESHHAAGSVKAKVTGANAWLHSEDDGELLAEISEIAANPETGFRIKVRLVNEVHPLWDLSFAQILFAIRTRTALGNTDYIWDKELNCDFKIKHLDASGMSRERESDCKYLLPVEGLKGEDAISIDDYIDWRSSDDRSDQEKRRKLFNKIVYRSGKKYQAGRQLRYWACFVPNRAQWAKLSKFHGIDIEEEVDDISADESFNGFNFTGGLFTSSKGMPTGIYLDIKPRGSAGYVPNFFILIEDPSLSFDIGRKAIQARQQGMLRDLAYEQFREFLRTTVKYISGSVEDPDPVYDREELFEEIKSLPDLESGSSRFVKRPNAQEATVAAMFFEQLGKGSFGEYQPYISGYKGRYDLYGRLNKRSNVLEFKFDLSGLFRDFTDEKKMFDEVDTLVLWEITERDRKLAANRGLTISEIESGVLNSTPSRFPGAHYKINLDTVKSIEILSMKKIVKPD